MGFIDFVVFPLWSCWPKLLDFGEIEGFGAAAGDENAGRGDSPAQIALQNLIRNRQYYNDAAAALLEPARPLPAKTPLAPANI